MGELDQNLAILAGGEGGGRAEHEKARGGGQDVAQLHWFPLLVLL